MADDRNLRRPRPLACNGRASIVFSVLMTSLYMALAPHSVADVPSSAFPEEHSTSLPYAGLFYGNAYAGDFTANAKLFRYEASRRFRAERSGQVKAVRYNNRILREEKFEKLCRQKPGSDWCRCHNAKLDRYTCGYVLRNSYNLGNGGLVTIEIQADDGTEEHLPSGRVLGHIKKPFIPVDLAAQVYPVFALAKPVRLSAGTIYHLVFRQLNPPKRCTTVRISPQQAKQCDTDAGAIALNGVGFTNPPTLPGGPFFGSASALLVRDSADDEFVVDDDRSSFYELQYDDGMWIGEAYAFYQAGTKRGSRVVHGRNQVRQLFTVRDGDRQVDGLWLRISRRSRSTQGTLKIRLMDDRTHIISKAKVPGTAVKQCKKACGQWVFATLTKPVSLLTNKTYALVLTSDQKHLFAVSSGFPIDYTPYNSENRNQWSDAKAQYSDTGGRFWKPFDRRGPLRGRDISVLFTLVGKPRRLP